MEQYIVTFESETTIKNFLVMAQSDTEAVLKAFRKNPQLDCHGWSAIMVHDDVHLITEEFMK